MSDDVVMQVTEGVAWVTLNRPDSMNAINNGVREAIPRLLDQAQADDAVRVVVVQGAGPKAFCTGADIREFNPVASLALDRQRRVHANWINAFERLRKPVIASIHGYCLGGGLEIALCCDIRIAADNAQFAESFLRVGLVSGDGGAWFLPRVIGLSRAYEMTFTADFIKADKAEKWGLASYVVPLDKLLDEAMTMAQKIAAQPPVSLRLCKKILRESQHMPLSASLEMAAGMQAIVQATKDQHEAVNAMLEKRKPTFTGK